MPAVKPARRSRAPVHGSRPTRPAPRPVDAASPIAHRNLPLLLLHAREAVLARFRPGLKAAGLTEQQWRIVRALVEDGPLEPRQIVERCRISSPSLAGVLARMAEQALVERRPHAADRRRQTVAASARSGAIARALAPRIEATYRALEAELGAPFVDDLYRALDALLGRLDVAPPPDAESSDAGPDDEAGTAAEPDLGPRPARPR